MDCDFDGIRDSSLRAELCGVRQDYYTSRQEPDDDEDTSSDESAQPLGDAATDESSSQNPRASLLIRKEDEDEEALVSKMLEESCGCSKFNSGPCSKLFDRQNLEEIRSHMLELTNTELDLIVLGQIGASLFTGDLRGHTRGPQAKIERSRNYSNFRYNGYPICLKVFLFLHTIGFKRYSNLLKHYRINGASPRTHGNEKRKPWHAAAYEDKQRAVTFIRNYADVHAMPLPGRLRKHQDYRVMLLPSDMTKRCVYNDYSVASQELTAPEGLEYLAIESFVGSGMKWSLT